MWISDRMWMGAQASPHTPFLAPWRFLLLRRSCCPGDVAESGLKRRRTIGLKGDVEEGSDPIAALTGRKAASDEANPYARRRVVLAWQSAERHAPGAQLHSTRVDQCGASSRSLNAPSGAQCFPTGEESLRPPRSRRVSMHLLVLSAFRPKSSNITCSGRCLNAPSGAQCFPTGRKESLGHFDKRLNAPSGAQCFPTMDGEVKEPKEFVSQCTFWCSVLSDRHLQPDGRASRVSMHLLVLSAFRLWTVK